MAVRRTNHNNKQVVEWLPSLTAIQEVPGSFPGYALEIFLEITEVGKQCSDEAQIEEKGINLQITPQKSWINSFYTESKIPKKIDEIKKTGRS